MPRTPRSGELVAAFDRSDDGTVWCTHRDVFKQLVGIAAEQGASRFLPTGKTTKAGVWIVHRFRELRHITPIPPH
ncbi:hypothetical protein [Rhodococcus wratislaviensis]|uniref:hypothetical protein n=1 Tax=Rhodococcus wratislaviensis TaxID=44752 RepID=UPI0036486414